MLAALVAGERDPQVLASLALGALKHKRPQLELALTGQFTDHHGTLLGLLLELIECWIGRLPLSISRLVR